MSKLTLSERQGKSTQVGETSKTEANRKEKGPEPIPFPSEGDSFTFPCEEMPFLALPETTDFEGENRSYALGNTIFEVLSGRLNSNSPQQKDLHGRRGESNEALLPNVSPSTMNLDVDQVTGPRASSSNTFALVQVPEPPLFEGSGARATFESDDPFISGARTINALVLAILPSDGQAEMMENARGHSEIVPFCTEIGGRSNQGSPRGPSCAKRIERQVVSSDSDNQSPKRPHLEHIFLAETHLGGGEPWEGPPPAIRFHPKPA